MAQTCTAAALAFFALLGDRYRAPVGTAAVLAWAGAVASPVQVSLAEPALSAATWSPGEAGVVVTGSSGELLLATTDHAVAGRLLGFSFDRSYRSGVLGYGPLGAAGWSSPLFAHLRRLATTGEVEYHDGSGQVWRFVPNEQAPDGGYELDDNGRYAVPKGLFLRLENLPGEL